MEEKNANRSGNIVSHERFLLDSVNALMTRDRGHYHNHFCDVTFEVEGCHFGAHRVILAAQSDYFRTLLLDGHFRESAKSPKPISPIPLPGKRAKPFSYLLSYLYSGRIDLTKLKFNDIVNLMQMAHEYQIERLFASLVDFLANLIDLGNVLYIFFDIGLIYADEASTLVDACLDFIQERAAQLVETPQFLQLPAACLVELLGRDEFSLDEWAILKAVVRWAAFNGINEETKRVVQQIRFNLINFNGQGLMTLAEAKPAFDLLNACGIDLQQITSKEQPKRNKAFLATENMATRAQGAIILRDGNIQNRRSMVSGRYRTAFSRQNPDFLTHTNHPLLVNNYIHENCFMTIALAKPCLVTSMLIDLPLSSSSSSLRWNYKVETSLDNVDWEPLADCQSCCGSQLLLFEHRKLEYIRIIGYLKHSEIGKRFGQSFCVLNFECPATNISSEERAKFDETKARKLGGKRDTFLLIQRDLVLKQHQKSRDAKIAVDKSLIAGPRRLSDRGSIFKNIANDLTESWSRTFSLFKQQNHHDSNSSSKRRAKNLQQKHNNISQF